MPGLFVNTLTVDDKYSCRNRQNFPQQFQMQLFQKPNNFNQFLIVFLKYTSNFEYYEKKDESHCLSISDIIVSEAGGYLNV